MPPDRRPVLPDEIETVARTRHRVNSGSTVLYRRQINWPSTVTLTDDSTNEEVDVAISGVVPGGTAGGDLGGTYPNPTVDGFAAWTDFVPTVAQGSSVTLDYNVSRYTQLGKTVIAFYDMQVSSAGTAATAVTVTLPVTASYNSAPVGMAMLFDDSLGAQHVAMAALVGSTTVFSMWPTDGTASGVLGVTGFTAALASGDDIRAQIQYQAA